MVTLGIITTSPSPALIRGAISLPTVRGRSHQPWVHAFTPRSPQSRPYSASFSGTVRGIGPRELETRYRTFRRIGNSSRNASNGSTVTPGVLLSPLGSVAKRLEFGVSVPRGNGVAIGEAEPEAIHDFRDLRGPAQIEVRAIFVGRLVVAVGRVVGDLLQAPTRRTSGEVRPGTDRN